MRKSIRKIIAIASASVMALTFAVQEQLAKQQRKQQRLHSMHLVRLHIMHTSVYSRQSLGSSVMNGIRKRMV